MAKSDRVASVAHQLERLRAFWPNLPATELALEEWLDILEPYTDTDIAAGVRRLIRTYSEMAAPKPAHLLAAIRYVRGDAGLTISQQSTEPEPLCHECGTVRTLWDDDIESPRNFPSHKETCSRHGERGTTAEDLARFLAERTSARAQKPNGPTSVGEIEPTFLTVAP